jgi:hypothetical protein
VRTLSLVTSVSRIVIEIGPNRWLFAAWRGWSCPGFGKEWHGTQNSSSQTLSRYRAFATANTRATFGCTNGRWR